MLILEFMCCLWFWPHDECQLVGWPLLLLLLFTFGMLMALPRFIAASICQLIFAISHRVISLHLFSYGLCFFSACIESIDDFTGGFSRQFNFSNCTFEAENEKTVKMKTKKRVSNEVAVHVSVINTLQLLAISFLLWPIEISYDILSLHCIEWTFKRSPFEMSLHFRLYFHGPFIPLTQSNDNNYRFVGSIARSLSRLLTSLTYFMCCRHWTRKYTKVVTNEIINSSCCQIC